MTTIPFPIPARPGGPAQAAAGAPFESASLAEERREVFESVLAALAADRYDADRMAAGRHLLRHLARSPAVCAGVRLLAFHAVEQDG